MSEREDLESRVDVIERFVMKHLAHLYAVVEPAAIPDTIDRMRSIYVHPTSPKPGAKPPVPEKDKALEPMESIYKHPTSPKGA